MRFIILTRVTDREKIYVNADLVTSVCLYYGRDTTVVNLVGETWHEVLESPETVVMMCSGGAE